MPDPQNNNRVAQKLVDVPKREKPGTWRQPAESTASRFWFFSLEWMVFLTPTGIIGVFEQSAMFQLQ
jgi:hypothetical protein